MVAFPRVAKGDRRLCGGSSVTLTLIGNNPAPAELLTSKKFAGMAPDRAPQSNLSPVHVSRIDLYRKSPFDAQIVAECIFGKILLGGVVGFFFAAAVLTDRI